MKVKNVPKMLIIGVMTLLLLVPVTWVAAANPPQPTYGTAVVDGNPGEWQIPSDFFADMILAGGNGGQTAVKSKLYLRYDCNSGVGYALVLAEPGVILDATEHYVKIQGPAPFPPIGSAQWTKVVSELSGNDGIAPDFAFYWESGERKGWEGSFVLNAPIGSTDYMIYVHSNFNGGNTSSVWRGGIPLKIVCGVPSAVTLANLAAAPAGNAIQVTWETASELNSLGFNLYRATSPNGPRTRLNASLIDSQAPGALGATYQFVDAAVRPGATYYYWLEAIDTAGASQVYGPISATAAPLRRAMPARPRLAPATPGFRH